MKYNRIKLVLIVLNSTFNREHINKKKTVIISFQIPRKYLIKNHIISQKISKEIEKVISILDNFINYYFILFIIIYNYITRFFYVKIGNEISSIGEYKTEIL